MDEMKLKLSTRFMKGLVAKLIKKAVRDKLGYNVDIQLNELEISLINGKGHIHTSVDVDLDGNDVMNVIKTIGLKD